MPPRNSGLRKAMLIERMFVQHSTKEAKGYIFRDQIYDIHISVNAGVMPIEYDPAELQQALERALNEYVKR
jgi:hypothetical protein